MTIGTIVRIVDDDPSVLDALSAYLRSLGHTVETFASGPDFLASDRADVPGCLILDVRMPGMSGLELFRELRRSAHPLPVIFLSAHGDIAMAVEAIRHGAMTFLEKPPQPEALARIVEEATELSVREERAAREKGRLLDIWRTLTPAEQQAAFVIAKGLKNADLAEVLGVSVWTAKAHRSAVCMKLGAENPIEVADFLRSAGIIL